MSRFTYDADAKTITFPHEGTDAQGDYTEEMTIPAVYGVCHDCEGEGSTLTESIRQHAYSAEEFAESFDDDEREEYMKGGRGIYGVTCPTCHGQRVLLYPDRDRMTPDQITALDAFEQWEADYAAECAAERRMGA